MSERVLRTRSQRVRSPGTIQSDRETRLEDVAATPCRR
ncbi:hypothetical protein RAJCM14343_1060 [Rhodococcus aetherivorans]|uniref:Uncharacterized protein n=1 Tax=Rhodococcus aetherivorans TaxID=191292 RepID=A0ABQ0YGY2_9NOCA|nr:hypothetical protein RAJCM14343_1060 [Rhodococcus aetherivorans]